MRALPVLLAVAALSLALPAWSSSAAPTRQFSTHDRNFAFWDASGSRVLAQGTVRIGDGSFLYTNRSFVWLGRTGCMWFQVSFTTLTGSVTVAVPPAGTVSTQSVGDWNRACGGRGDYVWLDGVRRSGASVMWTRLCISYSETPSSVRRWQACTVRLY
jgi:hypothetical protein